jgi:hypothetical protein
MFKRRNENKIKRRDETNNGPKTLKPFIIAGIIAFIVLISCVIFLCVEVLSKTPDEFFGIRYLFLPHLYF